MAAFFCRFKGVPPNLVTSGFLPGRSTVAWKQTRGPCGVVMVARCLRAIAVTVERSRSGRRSEAQSLSGRPNGRQTCVAESALRLRHPNGRYAAGQVGRLISRPAMRW